MNAKPAKARTLKARRLLRDRTRTQRAASRAYRLTLTGKPQPARVLLVAAGMEDATAKRFAPAFSRGIKATAIGETVVKLKGRATKRCSVKLYDRPTFATRLAAYRPKDKAAAAQFEAAAFRLAA